MSAYTISPEGAVFAVVPRKVQFRKVDGRWMPDPHIDGWERVGSPRWKPFPGCPADPILVDALKQVLEIVDWSTTHQPGAV